LPRTQSAPSPSSKDDDRELPFRSRFNVLDAQFLLGGKLKWDFDTWLVQVYSLKVKDLNKKELALAKKEYKEEYPPRGEGNMKLKTYPFKKHLDSKK
jgi:hypothetical protein